MINRIWGKFKYNYVTNDSNVSVINLSQQKWPKCLNAKINSGLNAFWISILIYRPFLFKNIFKRMMNCPVTRVNMNEPRMQKTKRHYPQPCFHYKVCQWQYSQHAGTAWSCTLLRYQRSDYTSPKCVAKIYKNINPVLCQCLLHISGVISVKSDW